MLKLEGVSLSYGSFRALDNVSLHADKGELVVLLGANGAGKSSIFMAISGINKTSSGSISFDGQELVGMKPSSIVEHGVVHCPEGRKLFPQMSVEQNLLLGGYVHYPQLKLADRMISARGGFSLGSGVSLTFKAKEHYGIRFFLDYNLLPSHSRNSGEYMNMLTLGASFMITL